MNKAPGSSSFGLHSTAQDVTAGLDLTGKNSLIAGPNSGIGYETARVLALRSAHIVVAARTEGKVWAALAAIGHAGTPVACELSEPATVRLAVDTVNNWGRPLDGIIANAGIMPLPELRVKHGFELQYLTNHTGHFILVTELLDQFNAGGRVVVLSFGADAVRRRRVSTSTTSTGARTTRPWLPIAGRRCQTFSSQMPWPGGSAAAALPIA